MKKLALYSILICLIVSCSKKDNPAPTADIYVVGYDGVSPTSWKVGETIVPGFTASITSGFVSGTDVYIAGASFQNGKAVPAYWKNGSVVTLPIATEAKVNSIFVSGTDVYAVGSQTNGTNVPLYWKNATSVTLPFTSFGQANSVFVLGSDVFIAGYDSNGVAYWKNGVKTNLSNSNSSAVSIFVSGSDVYIAGVDPDACYWKNGVKTALSTAGNSYTNIPTAILLKGSDVYVSGTQTSLTSGIPSACYWKNNTQVMLTTGASYGSSIFVSGDDVYVAGLVSDNTTTYPVYWKNGTIVNLSNVTSSAAKFIYVN